MDSLFLPALNLGILLVFLFVKLKKPVIDHVFKRHEMIRDEVRRVREMLSSAQAKHEEFSGKLKAIDTEVMALRDQARQDAASMKVRILTEAQRNSARVVSDARAASEGMVGDLRRQLAFEVGTAVVDRAQAVVKTRLTGDDRARIRKEFSTEVENTK